MNLYVDKAELFECDINIDGASLDKTQVRLVLESNSWNLMFYGSINNNGHCKINIDKLNILKEGDSGKMRLEVIAEDSIFTPWEHSFEVAKSKHITIESVSTTFDKRVDNKPKVSISNISEKSSNEAAEIIKEEKASEAIKDNSNSKMMTELDARISAIILESAIKEAKSKLRNERITINNFSLNEKTFNRIVKETIEKYKITVEEEKRSFVKNIVDFISQ